LLSFEFGEAQLQTLLLIPYQVTKELREVGMLFSL